LIFFWRRASSIFSLPTFVACFACSAAFVAVYFILSRKPIRHLLWGTAAR